MSNKLEKVGRGAEHEASSDPLRLPSNGHLTRSLLSLAVVASCLLAPLVVVAGALPTPSSAICRVACRPSASLARGPLA